MIGLPPHATEDSHIRYKLAQTLVSLAPSSFGREKVLTGSASRGVADNHSDVEMMFYFAINHQWEPDWKWLRCETERLTIKPERMIERIHDIFTIALSEQTVAQVLMLIRDTLKLVPAQYNVRLALANVEESLHGHGY